MRRRTTRLIAALVMLSQLSACVSMPRGLPQAQTPADAVEKMQEVWTETPVKKEGRAMVVLSTPLSPPKHVKDKRVFLELDPGATVKDMVAILANAGIPIMIADKKAGDKEFWLPRYSGTLGNLISVVSKATDVFFTWHAGTILVTGSEKISIAVPQDEGLLERIAQDLEAKAKTSYGAGMVTLEVTPSQLAEVRHMLERLTSNSAQVTLQVAVFSVSLDRETRTGIDWAKLQMALGKGAGSLASATPTPTPGTTVLPQNSPTTQTTSGTTTVTTTTPSAASSAKLPAGASLNLGSNALKAVYISNAFSLIAFINLLDTYGHTQTLQDIVASTTTGTEVELKSVTQIPYVENIGVATTGATTTNSTLLGSARTSTADDGITVKLTPMYDDAANTVTLDLNLSLKAVIAFNNLSAGNQLGQMTQPTKAERSFNNKVRLRPGQTAVLGGIIYESITDNRSGLPGLSQYDTASQNYTVKRNQMFIVVRPLVEVLGTLVEQEGSSLFGEAPDTKALQPERKPKGKRGAALPTVPPAPPVISNREATVAVSAPVKPDQAEPSARIPSPTATYPDMELLEAR